MTRYKGTARECAHCGETFLATQEHSTFTRKYCSHRCNGAALRARAEKNNPPREEIRKLYEDEGLSDLEIGKRYGKSHQWAFNQRKRHGIAGRKDAGFHTRNKPAHKKCDKTRWSIALKPAECCRNCGAPDGTRGYLQLHHVIPRSMSSRSKYDLRNGIQLCVACHMGWHQRRVVIHRDIFTAEEWDYISNVKVIGQRLDTWLDARYPERPKLKLADPPENGWVPDDGPVAA